MAQLQKVNWRTAGYAALGSAVAVASVFAIVRSDGVRPTSLTSSAATRWLVDQLNKTVVLADGLSGRVVARIEAEGDTTDEVAVQGSGGAFLVAPSQGSVRTISTAKLQLGTAQPVAELSEEGKMGVGASGLTVVNSASNSASIVAVDDVPRRIKVPDSDFSLVADDGTMWLFTATEATHVNIDESSTLVPLRGTSDKITTVGAHAVAFDSAARTVRWIDGGDVAVDSIANSADAVLQVPGDDAPCVWLGAGDTLACVGTLGIDDRFDIPGLNIGIGDRLAIAGTAAAVVREGNAIQRIDLARRQLITQGNPTVPASAKLAITAADDMLWIDDQTGTRAWVVHRFGINVIDKADDSAPLLDAHGQAKPEVPGGDEPPSAGADETGGENIPSQQDANGRDDPPKAVDDSVTARAGNTVIIPVTGNDYDPDGDAIALDSVKPASHGTNDVLNGTSVAYVPDEGFSGFDSFQYTIVDENGNEATAEVSVQLFAPDSPNRPPIARPDRVKTRLDRPITIDVLANDIDPERDILSVPTFQQNPLSTSTITDAVGPTDLPALQYTPPPGRSGIFTFTYQAADPQGGTSPKTTVTVDVSGADAANQPPEAHPDAIRLRVGVSDRLDVLANDVDPDGDELSIEALPAPQGVDVKVVGRQLEITLQPGANPRSTIAYTLRDGTAGHDQIGKVLALRIGDTAPNRPPVANPDSERVVVGNSVKIPVIANDIDPDHDVIRLLAVGQPDGGVGTTAVEGNSVKFTPNLPDISEPTSVTFTYTISDGKNHEATGNVVVSVLVEALPLAPFARDDFADTVTDRPVNIDVLANDSDPSGGQPHLIGAPRCPGGGSASPTDRERVTFSPPPGAVGTFRCKYQVGNIQGLMAEASIIVTVTTAPPGNQDPTMLDSTATQQRVNIGEQILLDVNDIAHDEDGDSLVFSSVTKPEVGSTTFTHSARSFVYSAPPTGSGGNTTQSVTLDVTISDGHDGNVRGLISIVVVDNTAIPSKPRTEDFAFPALAGGIVTVNVPEELRDQNDGQTLTVIQAVLDSGPASAPQVRNGVVVVETTGPGTVLVTYTVANSDALTATGTIRISVSELPRNDPPVAVDDSLEVASGGIASVNILTNDSGISDTGDRASVALGRRPAALFGAATLSNGVVTFVAAPDAAGVDAITYTLTDGSGAASTGTITVTILPCSDSAPAARTANIFTPYQTPVDIDLTQYVVSGGIRAGSVSGAGLTGPTGRYTPPAGKNGAETITYTVENGCRQFAHATLTIDVNRAPVGGTIDRALARGIAVTFVVSDLASDDEALQISSISGNPAWVSLVTATGTPGSFDGTTISAAPRADTPTGTYTFNATVTDPGGLTAVATISLAISNLAPSAAPDVYTTTQSLYTLDPLPTANDVDPEGGPIGVQTVSVTDGPGTSIVGRNGNAITVSLGHGVSTLSYTIRDNGGLTATSAITITSNRPPTVGDVARTTNQPTLDVPLVGTDPDGDPLVASCNSTPEFDVRVTPDPATDAPGSVKFDLHVTVLNGFVGTATFACTVTDTFNATAAPATVTLTIIPG